jgi:DNA polymerase-1
VTVRPLLVVDGDSFAHRAYHALPNTIRRANGSPGNALVGFTDMLVRLWQRERPRAVVVGWDTLDAPTYRHVEFTGYQSGREFDDELLEQLDLLPAFVASSGVVCGKAPGYEADDFMAACAQAEAERGGDCLVVTSDRDAFQLAGPRTTILRPISGVSSLERVGPSQVQALYGVSPEQVPDFIALRGDPSDRIPGAKGVGPKTAASVLAEHGTLEAALAAGRFPTQAEELRLFRRIATLDASAPLPSLSDQIPTWAEASHRCREWGLGALAQRLADLG